MVKDTSKDYDHMIDYVAEQHINDGSLVEFLGEDKKEYKPEVKKKDLDPEFPESWQRLYVNFKTMEDYYDFMNKIDEKPMPKLKYVIYKSSQDDVGIFEFLE